MYKPDPTDTDFGERVIVLTDSVFGYAFGQYTGYSRGGMYQIRVENPIDGATHDEWVHKKNIYKNTDANRSRVRSIVKE